MKKKQETTVIEERLLERAARTQAIEFKRRFLQLTE